MDPSCGSDRGLPCDRSIAQRPSIPRAMALCHVALPREVSELHDHGRSRYEGNLSRHSDLIGG